MAQGRFRARLQEEFHASKSVVLESKETLSLKDVRRMLADRIGAPQKDVDQEKKLIASLVDDAISQHSSAESKVI